MNRIATIGVCGGCFFIWLGVTGAQKKAPPPSQKPEGLIPPVVTMAAGSFIMGDTFHPNEGPKREIWLDAYAIGKYEVTHRQYKRFVDATGHRVPSFRADWARLYNWDRRTRAYPEGLDDHPVVLVSWSDAVAYCEWLSRETGQPYRLPTEAEWEKAARGGLKEKRFPWGDEFDRTKANSASRWAGRDIDRSHHRSWFRDEGDALSLRQVMTTPVGTFPPTGYGLYDVAGNVWEWCADWWGPYDPEQLKNPTGPVEGTDRVVRGGAYLNELESLRVANRFRYPPESVNLTIGFRVALSQTRNTSPKTQD